MEIGAAFPALLALSALCALAYGTYFLRRPPTLLRALVKAGMMGFLAAAFYGAPGPLTLAFALAAAGDFFIGFEDKPWALPLGMIAFLAMQLLYILMFFGTWMLSGDNAPLWPRYALMALTVLVIAGFLLALWRDPARKGNAAFAALAIIGALLIGATPLVMIGIGYLSSFDDSPAWGVWEWGLLVAILIASIAAIWKRRDIGTDAIGGMVYAAVIAQMALMSFWLPWPGWPAMLGALLFLVSDGVLSWELFRMKPDAPARRITAPIVWWTYAAAQGLIALGLVLAARASFV